MSNVFKGDCQRDSWSCLCFLPSQALLCPILHQPKAVVRDNVLYLQASLQSEMPHSSVVSCRKVKVLDKSTHNAQPTVRTYLCFFSLLSLGVVAIGNALQWPGSTESPK